jgi:chromate transporter
MIYLELFFTFLKIGAVSFGGGYGMISLMRDECISHAWLTEVDLLNFIAVAESTPGPIAVNMASFVGMSRAGVLGAFLATLGVVLPSFIIILLISSLFTRLLKYRGVKAVLGGIRPTIAALILGTGITMLSSLLFGIKNIDSEPSVDAYAILIFLILAAFSYCYKKVLKKPITPIILIIVSGIIGIVFYRFCG